MKIPFIIKLRNKLTPTRIIFLGFLLLILVGALLLTLPICRNDNENISFLDALFTATSASCVTGLVVKDTNTTWTPLGKSIILFLIQIVKCNGRINFFISFLAKSVTLKKA